MLFPIKINNQRSSNQELCGTDLINTTLPKEILNEIFSHLGIRDQKGCSQVCRKWNVEIEDPEKSKKRMYKQIAFNPEDWRKCFGAAVLTDLECHEALVSLPSTIYKTLKSPCPAFPGNNVGESHMLVWIPKTIQGKPLTLNSFGELAKKYFPESNTCYRYIWDDIAKQEGAKAIDQSGWVLMTKELLPGSRNKTYADQKIIVSGLAKNERTAYEVPTALKIAVCVLTHYFKSGERLFSNNPNRYTRCQESFNRFQLIVGGFNPAGLAFNTYRDNGNVVIGVAGMLKI